MAKLFPLVIATLILTAAGPIAVEWVGTYLADINAATVAQMQGALK